MSPRTNTNGGYIGFDTTDYSPKGFHTLQSSYNRLKNGTWARESGLRNSVGAYASSTLNYTYLTINPLDSGALVGELMVLMLVSHNGDPVSTPAGWTRLGVTTGETALFYKIATGSEPSITFDIKKGDEAAACCASFYNCDIQSGDALQNTGGGTVIPETTFTDASWGALLYGAKSPSLTPPSFPSDWSVLYSTVGSLRAFGFAYHGSPINPYPGLASSAIVNDDDVNVTYVRPLGAKGAPNPFPTINPN